MIEEVNFLFYVILINLDLNRYMDSTDSRLVVPLCLFPYDPITLCKVSLRESCLKTVSSGNTVEDFVFPLSLGWSIKQGKES